MTPKWEHVLRTIDYWSHRPLARAALLLIMGHKMLVISKTRRYTVRDVNPDRIRPFDVIKCVKIDDFHDFPEILRN